MNKILVTGKNGQLGQELRDLVLGSRQDEFVFLGREEMDLSSEESIVQAFEKWGPFRAVVSAGAWTAVDKAESEVEGCRAVNAAAPRILAELCAKSQIPMIQVSTDFVYGGSKSSPYLETDAVDPLSIYGLTKKEGEDEVLAANPLSMIIRTSWVYSKYGNNFVKTMRRLGAERPNLGVVSDQIGTPTWARDLAEVILLALDAEQFPRGIFHYSNQGIASWYDFATAIMEISDLSCKVRPILAQAYPTPAKRPSMSVMDKSKIEQTLGIEIPHWRQSLRDCIAQMD